MMKEKLTNKLTELEEKLKKSQHKLTLMTQEIKATEIEVISTSGAIKTLRELIENV